MQMIHIFIVSRPTWRITPVSKWLITMVIVSPLSRVVGPLPNGLCMAHKCVFLTTYKSWDDPPSSSYFTAEIAKFDQPDP